MIDNIFKLSTNWSIQNVNIKQRFEVNICYLSKPFKIFLNFFFVKAVKNILSKIDFPLKSFASLSPPLVSLCFFSLTNKPNLSILILAEKQRDRLYMSKEKDSTCLSFFLATRLYMSIVDHFSLSLFAFNTFS